MGSQELRAAIEAEGRARVAAILDAAELEATRLRREASSEAQQRQHDELGEFEAELRIEASRRVASARAEARKRVLDARDELIGRVFDGAREALCAEAHPPAAEGELIARAERALDYLPPDDPIVFACSSAVAPMLQAAFGKREGVTFECTPEIPTGFRATGAKGGIVIDATLESLLEVERPKLAIEILRQLHDDVGEGGAA